MTGLMATSLHSRTHSARTKIENDHVSKQQTSVSGKCNDKCFKLAYYTDMDKKRVCVQIQTYCFEWITFF